MKKKLIRLAAAAGIAGLVASMAPISAAFAASTPTYDTTTDAPIYLVDGTAYTDIAAGTQLDWNTAAGVVLSATPVPADLGDYSWATLPAPTGATSQYIAFVAPVGSERTPSAWKQWGDFSAIGSGASLPSVWPGYLGNGTPAAVKSAGGTYSMGVAYTDSAVVASTHVVKAYYTTINVDAGTGTWTFAAPPVACNTANTDIATTTSLVADKASVESGSSLSLTASVSASKTVSGNVEFFDGTTSLGSVGLAGGSTSKIITAGTVGDHAYSAKFVENVVETSACPTRTTDTFKASASSAVTVTVSAPAVPNGPSESALNVNTSNGATAVYDAATHTVTLSGIPAASEGKQVNAFAYSTLTYLGKPTVASGSISVDVSTLAAGDHKLAITDPISGDVIAWAGFNKSDAAISPSFQKQINADVANGTTPADGEFSLTNLSGNTVDLKNPTLVNGASVVSGELGTFKVTDMRQVSKPGWSLKTDVADFKKGTDTIAASALGIAPKSVSQAGTGAVAPTLGAAQTSGSASYPWNFATLAGGAFSGVSTYNADLVFTAPAGKPAGTYSSTITLTLVSN